ncbi:response regulator [Burkholderia sp. PU8-34]
MTEIAIALADDHPVVLKILMSLPHYDAAFRIAHVCKDGVALIDALTEKPTDLVITDFTMRQGTRSLDGIALLSKLRRVASNSKCLLFTAQTNRAVFVTASRLGVAGMISKEDDFAEVLRACRHLAAGGTHYLSPTVREILGREQMVPYGAGGKLTQKELDVVRLYVLGRSLISISVQLGRSVSTVSSQKSSAMQKLQVTSNVDLIRYAYESGLI